VPFPTRGYKKAATGKGRKKNMGAHGAFKGIRGGDIGHIGV